MKKIVNNSYANFYLNAAEKLNLKYKILNEKVGLVRIFNDQMILDVSANVLGVNSQIGGSLSENKVKTSILLQEKHIPVPIFETFKNPEDAIAYALRELSKEKLVVIKPISGSLSIGITISPTDHEQIKSAVHEAFIGNQKIMIEEFIEGRHYRVTVLDNEVIAVTQRLPANVVCDGTSTLYELIQKKNEIRKLSNLPEIFLREKDLQHLKNEGIELSKIYPEGLYVSLQKGCDLDIGGERVRIERNTLPQQNLNLFVEALIALGLRFGGIDYISPDITIPSTEISTAINEINSAPDLDVHYRDSYPYTNYAAERILEKIFFKNKITTQDIPNYLGIAN